MRRGFLVMFAAASLVAGVASSASAATAGTASSTHHPNVIDLACSSPLTLYDGTSLSGASVSISTRGLWINLSTVSFDNRTSSFAVGACAIDLASGTNGGGSRYPRCLSAGCVENSMASGWNNVVSSAFLH